MNKVDEVGLVFFTIIVFLRLLFFFFFLCDMWQFCQGPKGCFTGTSVQQEGLWPIQFSRFSGKD